MHEACMKRRKRASPPHHMGSCASVIYNTYREADAEPAHDAQTLQVYVHKQLQLHQHSNNMHYCCCTKIQRTKNCT
jgi:hypothetical protein